MKLSFPIKSVFYTIIALTVVFAAFLNIPSAYAACTTTVTQMWLEGSTDPITGHTTYTIVFGSTYLAIRAEDGDGCGGSGISVPASPVPTATLTATPSSIISGSSSQISWNSTNATSCTGTGFSTGNATSGTKSVSPSSSTTYSVSCTGSGGTASKSATVTVTPALSASCSASPTALIVGGSTTWSSSPSGGTGSYAYVWSGTDSLSGTTKNVSKTYSSVGTKTASVKITSGSQSLTKACSNSVTVSSQPDLTAGTPSVKSGSLSAPGNSVKFQSTVTNSGAGNTGTAITTRFELDLSRNGSVDSYITTGNISSGLNAGASSVVSSSANWTTVAGNHRVRSCTDYTGAISESNESNNCSSWYNFSVANYQCADGVDNDGNGVIDYPADSGCSSTSDNSEYTVPQCQDGIDNNGNGLIDTADAACTSSSDQTEEVLPDAVLSLTLSSSLARTGESTILTWGALNASSCSLVGTNGDSWALSGTAGTKTSSALQSETTFTLACVDVNDQSVSKNVTVKVTPSFQEI